MDDIVNVGVLVKDLVEGGFVCDVDVVEGGALAADELDAVADFGVGVVEVVDNDDLVVGLEKGQGCEGANIPGTAVPGSIVNSIRAGCGLATGRAGAGGGTLTR